jgi:hypothetical protein
MKHFRHSLDETLFNSAVNHEAMADEYERDALAATNEHWRKSDLANADRLRDLAKFYRAKSRGTEQ